MPKDGIQEGNAGPVSFRGRAWEPTPAREGIAEDLKARGLNPVVASIVATREAAWEDVEAYLDPRIKTLMPSPFRFKDMAAGAERIADAVMAGEPIALFSDYDVDGATSSAILRRYLEALGVTVRVHIPDRIEEGYGPNYPAIKMLHDDGFRLVCVLDSGTTAFDPLGRADGEPVLGGDGKPKPTVAELDMDVIVVDHHEAEPVLPAAVAVINPKRHDEDRAYEYLCTAGMAIMVASAVNVVLEKRGWFAESGVQRPNLIGLMDIAALGTVADVVPLVGLNRAIVRTGLQVMNVRGNVGMATLMDVGKVKGRAGAWECGFVLGPRVNAGGRVGEASTGSRLLSSDDFEEARKLAEALDAWNLERREIEKACVVEARQQVEVEGQEIPPVVFAVGEDWHEGVIGIVASRLKDLYNKPSIAFSRADVKDPVTGEDIPALKASGRSLKGFDIGSAVIRARKAGLLIKGGGHAMACGLTCAVDKLDEFKAFLEAEVAQSDLAYGPSASEYDAVLKIEQCTLALLEDFEKLEPFGQNNPAPRLLIEQVRIANLEQKDNGHMRLNLEQNGLHRKAMAFRAAGTSLGEGLIEHNGQYIDLIVELKRNEWRGRVDIDLFVQDARPARVSPTLL